MQYAPEKIGCLSRRLTITALRRKVYKFVTSAVLEIC